MLPHKAYILINIGTTRRGRQAVRSRLASRPYYIVEPT